MESGDGQAHALGAVCGGHAHSAGRLLCKPQTPLCHEGVGLAHPIHLEIV